MNNNEIITPTNRYSCDKCEYVYSPWLAKQCPKCKHKFFTLNTDKYVEVPMDLEYTLGTVTVSPPEYPTK